MPALPHDKLVVAFAHGSTTHAGFTRSMLDMLAFDMRHHQRIVNGGRVISRYSSVNVTNARNAMVVEFLGQTEAPWLLMVDADMIFAPDMAEALLAEADPVKAPIVGGLCFGIDDGKLFPTMYDLAGTPDDPFLTRVESWPANSMVQVAATGAAFLLVHRDALVAIAQKAQDPAYPWFRESVLGGLPAGEDVTFCIRAALAGLPVHVHTGVEIGHAKDQLLTAEMYRNQMKETTK